MQLEDTPRSFAEREVAVTEMELIREVVESCAGVSRTALAMLACELLGWRRPDGSLRGLECRKYLEQLEACGYLQLPQKRRRRPVGSTTRIPKTHRGEPGHALVGSVEDLGAIILQETQDAEMRQWFRELVGPYHYQGHSVARAPSCVVWSFRRSPREAVAAVRDAEGTEHPQAQQHACALGSLFGPVEAAGGASQLGHCAPMTAKPKRSGRMVWP